MNTFALSLRYRKAVEERNLDAILAVFSPDAVIVTPLKGNCDPKTYHEWFFATVQTATVKVINTFQALNSEISLAVLAEYQWLMHDRKLINFCGMSIFEFTANKRKIEKISIFYDTTIVRPQIVAPVDPMPLKG